MNKSALVFYLCLSFSVFLPELTYAAEVSQAVSSGITTQHLLQVVGALLFVILLIVFFAYFMRRVGGLRYSSGQAIKIISATSVGVKDRILLIEVGEQQLLVGVSSAGISKLHVFDAPVVTHSSNKKPVSSGFSKYLQEVLQQDRT